MNSYIRWFEDVGMKDLNLVGSKNASLGEMIRSLTSEGIRVPNGFAVTAAAYDAILDQNGLAAEIVRILKDVDKENISDLSKRAHQVRSLIRQTGLPSRVRDDIIEAYRQLGTKYQSDPDVAVRSSATAEDLPDASFAGQQETFLNVKGEGAVLESCLNCFASLFTERAISYRQDKGFDQLGVRLSVGVQKMVQAEWASAGVIFTLDTESGSRNVVLITSSYGYGENVVGGRVDPDEFLVFKPTLQKGFSPIIKRKIGTKHLRLIASRHGTRTTNNINVTVEERERLSLTDDEVILLAKWACKIEEHYSKLHGREIAMDIEWAKDGVDQQLYIVQARPETVFSQGSQNKLCSYRLSQRGTPLLQGRAIGNKIGAGPARIVRNKQDLSTFKDGEVLVADMTDPDWEPVMKRASAIVTNRGGRTCHAAIVSRELGVPCVVGTEKATSTLSNGEEITVCCAEGSQGTVYKDKLSFSVNEIQVADLPRTRTQIFVNLGDPEQAFSVAQLPVDGVGLAREEFIIANDVKIHPLALTRLDQIDDAETRSRICAITHHYERDRTQYFVDKLAEGVGMIAAAFYPRQVIVRLSDFKTNEYGNLIGGAQFEPKEDNPMIGFRGASRYYDDRYKDGFALECKALKQVRDNMGLINVKIMVPFCRTIEEGKQVINEMRVHGLEQGKNGLEVYVMCELPSNVIAADLFSEIFDGFSIGSNDLTQLTLGIDRDSELVARLFDERDPAVKRMVKHAIREAKAAHRKIGICGQAPSDYPEFAEFLVEEGIDSMSLNQDAVLKTLYLIAGVEKRIDERAGARDSAIREDVSRLAAKRKS